MTKTYTRQQADEILRRALATQPAEGIAHDDLVAAAREVGIPSSAIEAAALELVDNQRISERAAQIRRRKRASFLRHSAIFLAVNAGIFFVDRADGGAWFFQYPLIGWGILLLVLGVLQLAPDREALKRRAERELDREQQRASKRRQRAARAQGAPGASGAREFEAAVQEGVSTLLSVAARAIRGLTPEERYRVNEPDGDPPPPPEPQEKSARRSQRT